MAENEEKDSAEESTPPSADATSSADALVAGSDQSGARSPEVTEGDEPEPEFIETDSVDAAEELPTELREEEPVSAEDAAATQDVDSADADDRELVGVTAGTTGGSSSRVRSKKDKATARQRRSSDKPQRTTPVQFVKESVGELRKVVYPTGSQLANYFVVVLVFVLFIIAIVGLLDLGLGWAIFKVFS